MIPVVEINKENTISSPLVIFPGFLGTVLLTFLSVILMWLCYPIVSIVIDDKFLVVQFTGLVSSLLLLCTGLWLRHTQVQRMYDWQNLRLTNSSIILLIGIMGIAIGEILIGLVTLSPLSHFFESFRFYSSNNKFDIDIRPIHITMEVVIAPFVEELVWRGFILHGLLTHYSAPRAIIVNVLLFAVLHGFGAQTPSQILIALFLCMVFVSTRSVLLCFVLHSFHNFFLIIMDSDITGETILTTTSKAMATKSFHNLEYWIITIAGILFLSAGLRLLRRTQVS